MPDLIPTLPFVVTEALSKVYHKGLPSEPRLIAATNPSPFEAPTGSEAYPVVKELRVLGDHTLANAWDHGLADHLRRGLNTMCVNWTSIEALRIVEVGESSGPAIVWIGVEFGALSFGEGSVVALQCRTFIDSHSIHDYHVEIRESRVMRQAGNRFLDPVPVSDPTFTARNPYTATLSIPIFAKGGFYLSAGGDDKNIFLVTARHVVLPLDNNDNNEYDRKNDSKAREDVVVLSTSGFNENLTVIDDDIEGQESAITDAKERIDSVKGLDNVKEREEAEHDLQKAEEGLKALRALRHEIAPPIVLSTKLGQYTLEIAVIKIDAGMLDANNYCGNTIYLGNKYTRQQFMKKVYLHPTSTTSFKFPANRLVTLQDQVPASALVKQPMLDANGDPCLVVFKNGVKTGTTIGKANNVSSYTRHYFAGQYKESREWPVISTDKNSGVFSAKGDCGSCVADAFSRVGGILTGGSGAPDSCDAHLLHHEGPPQQEALQARLPQPGPRLGGHPKFIYDEILEISFQGRRRG
ncbi:uncharacterized protein LAESUDRAFT_764913 [Laetiporus sulphureus 93-53]|uniref:Uncharacterized protein n=1 Tax=Laetiporus sulphureus 93-53 TaxID=1314785 RepID=A0A165B257_9APHY|nr:uncharacterized protein LAESUDRAFT_764913 [Laetiporus sulphureus 93-53]KZT00087.1 hypothetical protein LAESUDRAFT_764913 [Laetiporus sulphureus 93-53]